MTPLTITVQHEPHGVPPKAWAAAARTVADAGAPVVLGGFMWPEPSMFWKTSRIEPTARADDFEQWSAAVDALVDDYLGRHRLPATSAFWKGTR